MWRRPGTDILRDMDRLPRWAKVAYAARCARIVFPLFIEHWPDALTKRTEAVLLAIQLAERSAAEGKSFGELNPAIADAVVTAGAAIMPFMGFKSDEPEPIDRTSGFIVSFVANSAASAVKAAQATKAEVTQNAIESYGFARDAAMGASAELSLREFQANFIKLGKFARGGIRRSPTLFPPTFFESR
jgi:hypothetical protein